MKPLFFIMTLFLGGLSAQAQVANYTVPVSNERAQFALSDFQITGGVEEDSDTYLQYTLPEDLTAGVKHQVNLMLVDRIRTPNQKLYKFLAEDGSWALCSGLETGLSCTVEYEELSYNREDLNQYLRDKYSEQPLVLEDLLEVGNSFASDPIGILGVECPKPNCSL